MAKPIYWSSLLLLFAPVVATALSAQSVGQSGVTLGFGLFAPAAGLGTRDAGAARLESAPAAVVGFDLWPRRTALGLRVALVEDLTSGYHVDPTAACQSACTSTTLPSGRFWALTASVVRVFGGPNVEFELELGGGVRQYSFAELICACNPPPPGTDLQTMVQPLAFYRTETAPVGRLGGSLRFLVGGIPARLTFADDISRGPTGQVAHDLVAFTSVTLPTSRRPGRGAPEPQHR